MREVREWVRPRRQHPRQLLPPYPPAAVIERLVVEEVEHVLDGERQLLFGVAADGTFVEDGVVDARQATVVLVADARQALVLAALHVEEHAEEVIDERLQRALGGQQPREVDFRHHLGTTVIFPCVVLVLLFHLRVFNQT